LSKVVIIELDFFV